MSFEPLEFLRHILVESDYLLAASAQVTREQFERDETFQRTCVLDIPRCSGARWRACAIA